VTNRVRVVVAAAILLSVAMSSVAASAASIGTVASRLFSASAPVSFASTDRSVTDVTRTISGSPAAITSLGITVTGPTLSGLNGQAVSVTLVDSTNAVVTTVTGTINTATGGNTVVGATAVITLAVSGAPSASAVTGWATFIAGVQVLSPTATPARTVTIGNGSFPVTTWQQTLVPAADPNTNVTGVTIVSATTVTQCLAIVVTGKTAVPTAWALSLDFGGGPYWGVAPSIQRAVIQSTTGTVMSLVGTSNPGAPWDSYSNNALITSSQTVSISVCQNNAATAPNRPEAYTTSGASVLTTTNTGGNARACETVTVTGNNTYPFYFGWSVPINVAPAIAYLKSIDPAAPRSMAYTPDVVSPAYSATTTSYTVSNYRDDAIAGTQSRTVTICLNQY